MPSPLRPSIAAAAALLLACTAEPADGSATASQSGTTGDGTTSTTAAAEVTSTAATDASATAATSTTGAPLVPGDDALIPVFEGEHVYFGDVNRRQVDVTVDLPEGGEYDAVTLNFALSCPNGLCDHWDRYGNLAIVLNAGSKDEQVIEIDRFITAYRVGMDWEADLTDLRPLLTGTVTFRVFIDTWVGPGHSDGEGWLFHATFDYAGGPPPSPEPIAVIPAWGHLSWSAGLDDNPVEAQVVPQTLTLPPDATAVTLRSFITGHGWNNSQNCAEFCSKWHYYTVNGNQFGREVWRDDCEYTVTDGDQQGTWWYDRAGWCPGAQVFAWDTDVTPYITGDSAEVSYELEPFTWTGDGDQPYYYMSGVLIAYR